MIPSVADKLTGAFPVLPTPFHDDQSLDLDGLRVIIERLLDAGIRGFTVLGSGSESAYLADEERAAVVEHAVKTARARATVVAGIMQFGTSVAVEQAHRFHDLGADALLVGLPQAYDMPLVQVIQHFTTVVREGRLPTLYYHPPKPPHLSLAANQVGSLFAEVSLVGIENGSPRETDIRAQIRAVGRPISMFTADSAACLACLAEGGVGAMCPVSVLMPKSLLRVVQQYHAGNDALAEESQARVAAAAAIVRSDVLDGEPASALHWGVKEALLAAGILKSAAVRSPQSGLSDARRDRMREAVRPFVEL